MKVLSIFHLIALTVRSLSDEQGLSKQASSDSSSSLVSLEMSYGLVWGIAAHGAGGWN